MQIINRLAILMQFSAVSVLLLMWSRVLKISRLADKLKAASTQDTGNPRNTRTNSTGNSSSNSAADPSSIGTISTPLHIHVVDPYHQPVFPQSPNAIAETTSQELIRRKIESRQKRYVRLVILLNLIVYGLILGSLAVENKPTTNPSPNFDWYDVNIMMLSLLCMLEAVMVLFVGVRTALKISNELSPVYMTSNSNFDHHHQSNNVGDLYHIQDYFTTCFGLSRLWYFLIRSDHSRLSAYRGGLQVQKEVLRTLLSVSAIACLFFVIRSFGFMYRPWILENGSISNDNKTLKSIFFPFFFYQLPELIPNIAILVGISPPNGILRVGIKTQRFCFFSYDKEVQDKSEKDGYSNQSEGAIADELASPFNTSKVSMLSASQLFSLEQDYSRRSPMTEASLTPLQSKDTIPSTSTTKRFFSPPEDPSPENSIAPVDISSTYSNGFSRKGASSSSESNKSPSSHVTPSEKLPFIAEEHLDEGDKVSVNFEDFDPSSFNWQSFSHTSQSSALAEAVAGITGVTPNEHDQRFSTTAVALSHAMINREEELLHSENKVIWDRAVTQESECSHSYSVASSFVSNTENDSPALSRTNSDAKELNGTVTSSLFQSYISSRRISTNQTELSTRPQKSTNNVLQAVVNVDLDYQRKKVAKSNLTEEISEIDADLLLSLSGINSPLSQQSSSMNGSRSIASANSDSYLSELVYKLNSFSPK
eukprot:gene13841-18564_t